MWALLIQLQLQDGPQTQHKTFAEAVHAAPKSGEVWCEGARLCMNPFGEHAEHFDLEKAERYLGFALRFTPQYGDSFVEQLRLQILLGMTSLIATPDDFAAFDGSRNPMALLVNAQHIVRVCTVADPNYGDVWFHCKQQAYESVHDVFLRAKQTISQQVWQARRVYMNAIHPEWGVSAEVAESAGDNMQDIYEPGDLNAALFATAIMAVGFAGSATIVHEPMTSEQLIRVLDADPIIP